MMTNAEDNATAAALIRGSREDSPDGRRHRSSHSLNSFPRYSMFDLVGYLRALVRRSALLTHAPIVTKASGRIQRYLSGPSLCIEKY